MNFVKGVADLIRRTSAGQSGDFSSGSKSERFSPPSPIIRFRYSNLLETLDSSIGIYARLSSIMCL